MESRRTFKIFLKDDIRRFTTRSDLVPTWDEFVERLFDLFRGAYHPEMRVYYKDAEGDKINITCQLEWEEALVHLTSLSSMIKLYIDEGAKPEAYFKDSPPPLSTKVYLAYNEGGKEGPKIAAGTVMEAQKVEEISTRIPMCLQRLFKGGKILPYNIPEWMKPAVNVNKVFAPTGEATDEVDVDIDVKKLFEILHRRGLDALNAGSWEEGKRFMLEALEVVPGHPVALYNVACAEALLGRAEQAVRYLEEAVENGYRNVEHMVRDDDLVSLRENARFNSLVRKLRGEMEENCVIPSEEKKPEIVTDVKVTIPKEEVKEKEKEKEKEQEPEVIAPKTEEKKNKLMEQLEILETMGFSDQNKNIEMLVKHRGDILAVVRALLNMD